MYHFERQSARMSEIKNGWLDLYSMSQFVEFGFKRLILFEGGLQSLCKVEENAELDPYCQRHKYSPRV